MSSPQRHRSPLPAFVATSLLIIFSASGLMAGGLTFKLAGGISFSASRPTPSTTVRLATLPTRTPTPIATTRITAPFNLSILLQPDRVRPGQVLSVTITAINDQTQAPVAGLRCYLDDPTDGSAPLLTRWPAATATNANGEAHWSFVVPQLAPGTYEIGYGASGSSTNWYHGQETVLVTA